MGDGQIEPRKREIFIGFIGEFGGSHHGAQLGPLPIPVGISPKFLQTLVDNVSSAGGDMKLVSPFLPEQLLPEPQKRRDLGIAITYPSWDPAKIHSE